MLITPDGYNSKEEYLTALEEEAEKCKSAALTLVASLDHSCYNVPYFDKIDQYLKFAEGSIKKARKTIKIELRGRETNRERQQQKLRQEQQKNAND